MTLLYAYQPVGDICDGARRVISSTAPRNGEDKLPASQMFFSGRIFLHMRFQTNLSMQK